MKIDIASSHRRYEVIYADPPWSYSQHGTGPKSHGSAKQHYRTMAVKDICALPVRQHAPGWDCWGNEV